MDYLIGFLLIILLPASIIFNIILIRRGISLVKQNEQLTDIRKD
jgi:K+-transporting ATPase A subunit